MSAFILCCCVAAISSSARTFTNTVTESRIIATSNTPPSAFSHNVITSSLDDGFPFTSSGTFTSASSSTQRESLLPMTSGNKPVSVSPSITYVTPAQLPTSTEEPETGTDKKSRLALRKNLFASVYSEEHIFLL